MEIISILILYTVLGWGLSRFTINKSSNGEYKKITDTFWLTPTGFVDLTPRLTHSQEMHNLNNKLEREMADVKYESDVAWAQVKKQIKQWDLMKEDVYSMSHDKKLSFIPKWVDYIVDWKLKDKTKDERMLGYMPFEHFIASEIIPFKSYGEEFVWRKQTYQLEYVI